MTRNGNDMVATVGGLAILAFMVLATLIAAPAAMDTLTGHPGHYVTDLESHLVMCEQPDIIDRPDCVRTAYETWQN